MGRWMGKEWRERDRGGAKSLLGKKDSKGEKVNVSVCKREERGVGGTMVQSGCSDPGKTKLSPGPWTICII